MPLSSVEKFRKLVLAYEDEVQRKQHKMGKRVDPRDVVEPKPATGYCSFLRGQQVVWSPSYEVIGTLTPATGTWIWGFSDPTVEPRLVSRLDAVRKQGLEWGIDELSIDAHTLGTEQEAWEFATVAVAIARADAMVRIVGPNDTRWLALFDGPPASRSSASMRAIRESQMGMPAMRTSITNTVPVRTSSSPSVRPALGHVATNPDETEPTGSTRADLGQRLFELIPYALQQQLGIVQLRATATPPSGPVGTVSMHSELSLTPAQGGPPIPLNASRALEDSLVALWIRCRDRQGPFRFCTARLENGPQGFITQVFLE